MVTVANNHGADYGPEGLRDTLQAVERSPIPVIGVGRDRAAAFAPYRVTVDRTRIAFLAGDASPLESRSPVWRAGPGTPGLAAAHGARPHALLAAVRRAAAHDEVVAVYLHWGTAHRACPSPAQRSLASDLAAAGADVIVGSHAHVQQGAGWLGDTYVAYGLGNFLWYHDGVPDSGVLRVRVEDGHVVSDGWAPARIPQIGPPVPLHGRARAAAVARWRSLRGCAGLAARPATEPAAGPSPSAGPSASLPAYASTVRRIGPRLRARMRSAHRPGCPVPWSHLRSLRLSYVGFDGAAHTGEVVVAAGHARDVVGVFGRLYRARWPIRQLRPVSDFGGDDERSMAADNSSGSTAATWPAATTGRRTPTAPRSTSIPSRTPTCTTVRCVRRRDAPSRGSSARRGQSLPPGTIRADDIVVRAFAEIGWEWGGQWSAPDYQHFAAAP